MRALLLAAGLGTRLQPLTNHLPKCMVPIHGRPLLDYWLENLLDQGIDEVLVNTHYMAPIVVQFLQNSTWKDRVRLVHEEKLHGTGGTIIKNRAFFRDETCMVAHADNLTIFDFADFARCHVARPMDAVMTLMVFETTDPTSCGIVELDARGVVQAFHEKVKNPPSNLANAAVYILEPSVLNMMASLGKDELDFSTAVIPNFLGKMFAYRNTAYHRDIGNIISWVTANRDFPISPANAQNCIAWSKILSKNKGEIEDSINQLLTDVGAANARP
ncbi:MAG: nucleotidyltransferase family protein [Polynucleobacter sp.]|uniref:nucleotidyltransferase family protein n=1 Tax=Polynucleobacter sp. TaxID=2029855 RepID=UPI0027271951|nr:nucleotidyltransferase family protein [Polynucleobacter sp.]MDO8713792.1 nucleotidyltransferase family protein [Polynucleobacter sp.]